MQLGDYIQNVAPGVGGAGADGPDAAADRDDPARRQFAEAVARGVLSVEPDDRRAGRFRLRVQQGTKLAAGEGQRDRGVGRILSGRDGRQSKGDRGCEQER